MLRRGVSDSVNRIDAVAAERHRFFSQTAYLRKRFYVGNAQIVFVVMLECHAVGFVEVSYAGADRAWIQSVADNRHASAGITLEMR